MKPIYILNGPNLNLLGKRQPEIYGTETLDDVARDCMALADELGLDVRFHQSNWEGQIVDWIHEAREAAAGIVINPAAYTHTSVAILDALKAVAIPAVEVHLSDVRQREDFRQISYARLACVKTYMGLGFEGYRQAILFLKDYLHTHTV